MAATSLALLIHLEAKQGWSSAPSVNGRADSAGRDGWPTFGRPNQPLLAISRSMAHDTPLVIQILCSCIHGHHRQVQSAISNHPPISLTMCESVDPKVGSRPKVWETQVSVNENNVNLQMS